jgi:hypothetical protein
MSNASAQSAFRIQVTRLAWLFAFLLLGNCVLMWLVGHGGNDVLVVTGFGLFAASTVFSLLARRFSPFACAFAGMILLAMSICA